MGALPLRLSVILDFGLRSRDERSALRCYCSHYADVVAVHPEALVVEGVHIVGAVLPGLGPDGRYAAAAPLPDPRGLPRLAQDAPMAERPVLSRWAALPGDWRGNAAAGSAWDSRN